MITQVKDCIWSVGALNPAMRVFDIVMTTEYGTSYNSYLVRGTEKTALIDACHKDFFAQYLNNIEEVCDPTDIDYIVLNHNEPDHTGALALLLEKTGPVTIYATHAGAMYIKGITNLPNLDIRIIKDGEELDLGGKTLRFVPAPFLHWPDSMFTYLPEDKIVFTCDFLGAHYCEPYAYDYAITRPEKYEEACQGYFDAIFGPFKKYVVEGLHKLEQLDFDMVLNSHGPILTRGEKGKLDWALKQYHIWSRETPRDKKIVPVFYTSAYGNTKKMAEAIACGIEEELSAQVELYDIIEEDMDELCHLINHCDGFALGTPTINRDAVPPVWNLLTGVDAIGCQKKPCAVFGSYGWSGEGVPYVIQRLSALQMDVVSEGLKVPFVPAESDLAKARELGRELGRAVGGQQLKQAVSA